MKKTVFCLAIMTAVFACNNETQEGTFEIDGKISNTTATTVYLEENVPNGQPTIVDSATIKAGEFHLKTSSREESLYQLRLNDKTTPFALLISDVPQLKIKADLNNGTQPYIVEGSSASQALIDFDKAIYKKAMELFVAGSKRDSLKNAKATDSVVAIEHGRVNAMADSLKSFAKNFLEDLKSPVLTLYALSSFQNTSANVGVQGFSKTEITEIISRAATKFPSHAALQNVNKNLSAINDKADVSVTKAIDFSQPGIDGKPVSLSSFKGKYVLLDFWASWCKPCRVENPNVVKAYQEFKDKNFTVFGVSLDKDKNAWLQAIQQDGLTWTHASDLKDWSNEAAALYGVQSIPANFLIDPQGNIIARDLRGEELTKQLRVLLK